MGTVDITVNVLFILKEMLIILYVLVLYFSIFMSGNNIIIIMNYAV